MKHIKNIILVAMVVTTIIVSSGCTSLENYIVKDQPDYAAKVNGPMTAVEYTNKVNRTIVPFMNEGDTLLAHHLDIAKGTYPAAQEVALVNTSLNNAQKAIETIDALYPPEEYTDHKAQAILHLNEYKDALKRYKEALQSGDNKKLSVAADGIKTTLASLKTSYSLYQ